MREKTKLILFILLAVFTVILGGIGIGFAVREIESQKVDWSFSVPQTGVYENATSIVIGQMGTLWFPREQLPYTYIGNSSPGTTIKLHVEYYGYTTLVLGTNIQPVESYLGTETYEFTIGK